MPTDRRITTSRLTTGRGAFPRASRTLLLLFVLLCGGCLKFQQGPTTIHGTRNFVKVGAEKIYIEDKGEGPVVLLIHGFGASNKSWRAVRPGLLERGFRVLAVDLPGHGFSDKYEGDYSIKAVGRKVFAVLERKGIERLHLVAHSWGTAVALGMAQLQPKKVRSLSLLSSFAYEDQLPPFLIWARAPGMGEFLFTFIWDQRLDDRLDYAFYDAKKFAHPDAADEARALFKRPGALAAALAAVRGMRFAEMEKRYSKMATPTLIISGKQDRVTRLPAARRLNAELPDSRHLVLPRCGHMPLIEHPNKVVRALHSFWTELRAREQGKAAHSQPSPTPDPATYRHPSSPPPPPEDAP